MRRLPTNTPLQAFVTLNDPAFVEMAQALGRRVVREGGASVADRVRYGLKLALSRSPTDAQVQTLVALYEKELAHFRTDADAAQKLGGLGSIPALFEKEKAGASGTAPSQSSGGPVPAGLGAAEAAAWTVVGNVLLNLDGVLTKG